MSDCEAHVQVRRLRVRFGVGVSELVENLDTNPTTLHQMIRGHIPFDPQLAKACIIVLKRLAQPRVSVECLHTAASPPRKPGRCASEGTPQIGVPCVDGSWPSQVPTTSLHRAQPPAIPGRPAMPRQAPGHDARLFGTLALRFRRVGLR